MGRGNVKGAKNFPGSSGGTFSSVEKGRDSQSMKCENSWSPWPLGGYGDSPSEVSEGKGSQGVGERKVRRRAPRKS